MMNYFNIIALLSLTWLCLLYAKSKKIHINYPIELLNPIVGKQFIGTSKQNQLTCFSNRDYPLPTYTETLFCLLHLKSNCVSIWGSRSAVIEVNGSVEFFKLSNNNLPPESNIYGETIDLHASRWLELTSNAKTYNFNYSIREIKQIPCEPIVLCARSNDWTGSDSNFYISFKSGYIREKDRELSGNKSLIHLLLIGIVSSAWLLPYLAAIIIATISYQYALKYIILITVISIIVLCTSPLMFTKGNRYMARQYLSYFFTRIHEVETLEIIKKRKIIFQAVYFSTVLICLGLIGSHILYFYFGIDRSIKNTLIKLSIGAATSWLAFSLCRSFERFCCDWSWIVLCIGLYLIIL